MRTQITKHCDFPPDILKAVKDEARQRGIAANELIREAVVLYLTQLRVDRELTPTDRSTQLR
jgi:hypothetical protein